MARSDPGFAGVPERRLLEGWPLRRLPGGRAHQCPLCQRRGACRTCRDERGSRTYDAPRPPRPGRTTQLIESVSGEGPASRGAFFVCLLARTVRPDLSSPTKRQRSGGGVEPERKRGETEGVRGPVR